MSTDSDEIRPRREYPRAPIVGVAGVVLCGDRVLLIRRGREPLIGAWSLPGGALELGETTAEGISREIFEETGVQVRPIAIITTLDRILRDADGAVQFHYVLVEWFCVADDCCDPICGDDAADARWVLCEEVFSATYKLDETTLGVIEGALKIAETMQR
ncbi:NUDIX hydrolase [Edaphobacter flagellatus]|uniref:NUDIX hydrolase n=1 Tax=Edaphobacter flagellatus TaxID=1933044 RepID=UPI0021B3A667|nr:NUDIX hydrolase [Edaphobacter flagellatus]